ncbi:hypothetical protein B1813_18900 [Saccharomonospora piscinae]|uniref:Uncharacterized protein n=1 Tax=Saccharomonospora piscinae TaxID=687388 RepID=A0A1V8ZYN7_SACPI|nr:hypothetical protein [Saccharomonospora piscinae]OQO89910.1 hypothetical protein B1813_18900 [Saccharomonospora piscinae]
MTTTPESWEQQLHDAANAIPDSLRSRLYAESWSDGTGRRAVDLDRAADIAHAEVERLTAERAALWHLLRKQTRQVRTWRRRAHEAIAEAVEDTGRHVQHCGQLRRELDRIARDGMQIMANLRAERDETRAEVKRLRGTVNQLHAAQEAIVTEWRAVLDRALPPGTQGAGQGLAADVALIASQRDEARAEADRLRGTVIQLRTEIERQREQRANKLEAKREAVREARRVISQYLVTAEKWRYDRVMWALAIMLGEIPEDTPEPPSPADVEARAALSEPAADTPADAHAAREAALDAMAYESARTPDVTDWSQIGDTRIPTTEED